MVLHTAANGHLTLDFDDSPEVLWEEVIAHLLAEGFVRDGVAVLGPGQSIFPGFVREGIALSAGWDEWSGNYLLSHSDDSDSFLNSLYTYLKEK